MSSTKREKVSRHALFVGGFFGAGAAEVHDFFAKYGELESVLARGNGFAFVEYRRKDGASKALQQLQTEMFNDQFVFGKRAEKKSVRKRRKKAKRSKESGAVGEKDKDKREHKREDKREEKHTPSLLAPPSQPLSAVSSHAQLQQHQQQAKKRGKDAVYLSSDEDEL